MSTRSERDKQKSLQERHQMILSNLLKDEDNKYCVDCDAKGPRWASWNLGIFLCIRCAGIHRNLGVHISKVKSVNLDTWTPEQVAMMQEMGNSRARAAYEANIPDHFRRPQSDSSLEAFIRAKYETKKYIAKEWIPPKPVVPPQLVEEKKEKKKSKPKSATSGVQLGGPQPSKTAVSRPESSRPAANGIAAVKPTPAPVKQSNIDDLLGLDDPTPANTSNDIFSEFMSAPAAPTSAPTSSAPSTSQATPTSTTDTPTSSANNDLEPSLFGDGGGAPTKSTKESILALYGSGGPQQTQMFGVPGGMYMGQQGGQSMPGGNMSGIQNGGMMPNMGMMGMQQGQGNMQQGSGQMGQMGMQGQQMMGQNMYNMYNMQPQQQMSQMTNQMAGLNMGSYSGSSTGWNATPTGQTLSTNLWQ